MGHFAIKQMRMIFSDKDKHFMRVALSMARQGLGRTWPNPSVGCVIVKNGDVMARAVTAHGGRPHAETAALLQAGVAARGADVYVTLEPCCHRGQTGPCAQALIEAGVARVFIATGDPDARVDGGGVAMLRSAGITVYENLMGDEARNINRGFSVRVTENRPLVTLKTATSRDGKIASANGESKWITGELARSYGRLERSMHDAVAVGIGTVLLDNPGLTPRLSGSVNDPIRIVFDTYLRLKADSKLLKNLSTGAVWAVCHEGAEPSAMNRLREMGVTVMPVPLRDGVCDIRAALSAFAGVGITRLMVEGGATLMTSFLREGLWDRLLWFQAPTVIGEEGLSAVGRMGGRDLSDRTDMILQETRFFGPDRLDIYQKKA